MIEAQLIRNKANQLVAYRITGHAFNGKSAHDVVCAGVSALAINCYNSIQQLAHITPILEIDQVDGGLMAVELPLDGDARHLELAVAFLDSLALGLEAIAQEPEYAPFISIIKSRRK